VRCGGLSWFGAIKFKVPTRKPDVWGTRATPDCAPPAVYYCFSKLSARRRSSNMPTLTWALR